MLYVSDVYMSAGGNRYSARLRLVVVCNFDSSKGEKILERSVLSLRGFTLLNMSFCGAVSL